MIDREKVIKGLTCCQRFDCESCPYYEDAGSSCDVYKDALELLKEDEESVKPLYQGDDSYACEKCGETVGWKEMNSYGQGLRGFRIDSVHYKFCPSCGKKVNWDE